jgi:hypothetical protein
LFDHRVLLTEKAGADEVGTVIDPRRSSRVNSCVHLFEVGELDHVRVSNAQLPREGILLPPPDWVFMPLAIGRPIEVANRTS